MKRLFGSLVVAYLPATALLAITAGYLVLAYAYAPESRLVPAGVAWVMIALLVLDLAARTRTRLGDVINRWLNAATTTHGVAKEDASAPAARQIAAVLWVAGFTAALALIGILAAVPIYVFASLRFRGRRNYGVCLAVGAGTALAIWLLFAVILRIDLYPGLFASSV